MTTTNNNTRTTIAKILFLLSLCLMGYVCSLNAQQVKQTKDGNYIAVKSEARKTEAKNTGKTYTDTKGIVYPVMISKNGKLFIIRTSKTGRTYNQYLKLN